MKRITLRDVISGIFGGLSVIYVPALAVLLTRLVGPWYLCFIYLVIFYLAVEWLIVYRNRGHVKYSLLLGLGIMLVATVAGFLVLLLFVPPVHTGEGYCMEKPVYYSLGFFTLSVIAICQYPLFLMIFRAIYKKFFAKGNAEIPEETDFDEVE